MVFCWASLARRRRLRGSIGSMFLFELGKTKLEQHPDFLMKFEANLHENKLVYLCVADADSVKKKHDFLGQRGGVSNLCLNNLVVNSDGTGGQLNADGWFRLLAELVPVEARHRCRNRR